MKTERELYGRDWALMIRGVAETLPEEKRRDYLLQVAERLRGYRFQGRKKSEPKIKKPEHFERVDLQNPQEFAELIIFLMQPYYRAQSQNKIKDWIVNFISDDRNFCETL